MRNNPKDALEASPFVSYCQLKDFLSNLEGRKRVVQTSY
jgi:hypothetical protein